MTSIPRTIPLDDTAFDREATLNAVRRALSERAWICAHLGEYLFPTINKGTARHRIARAVETLRISGTLFTRGPGGSYRIETPETRRVQKLHEFDSHILSYLSNGASRTAAEIAIALNAASSIEVDAPIVLRGIVRLQKAGHPVILNPDKSFRFLNAPIQRAASVATVFHDLQSLSDKRALRYERIQRVLAVLQASREPVALADLRAICEDHTHPSPKRGAHARLLATLSAIEVQGHKVIHNEERKTVELLKAESTPTSESSVASNSVTPVVEPTVKQASAGFAQAQAAILNRLQRSIGRPVSFDELLSELCGYLDTNAVNGVTLRAILRTLYNEGHFVTFDQDSAMLHPTKPEARRAAPAAPKAPSVYDFGRILTAVSALPPELTVAELTRGVSPAMTCKEWAEVLRTTILTLATTPSK